MGSVISKDDAFIQKMAIVVENNIHDEKFGVENLVKEMGMSHSQLYRRTRNLTGLSITQFIRKVRLERAMELLTDGVGTISEIAYQVGFSSPSYFTHCFVAQYGITPGEVISRQQNGRSSIPSFSQPVASQESNRNAGSVRILTRLFTQNSRTRSIVLLGCSLGILLVIFTVWYNAGEKTLSVESEVGDGVLPSAVAVIPFRDMNSEAEDYFTNGQWEAVLSSVSKIGNLRVISRQTMEQYRNSRKTATEIGSELRVDYLLEGSVYRKGGDVKIAVYLVDAQRDQQTWSRVYLGSTSDVFRIHHEIATAIGKELNVLFNGSFQANKSLESQIAPDVYDQFLNGRHFLNQYYTSKDTLYNEEALNRLAQVIELAPDFSQGYVLLGDALYNQFYYNKQGSDHSYKIGFSQNFAPDTCLALWRTALVKNSHDEEAHLRMGDYFLYQNGNDVLKAIEAYKTVLSIDPNNIWAKISLANQYMREKQFDQAVPLLFDTFRDSPSMALDDFGHRVVSIELLRDLLMDMGMYEEGFKLTKIYHRFRPEIADWESGVIARFKGNYDMALYHITKVYQSDTNNIFYTHLLAEIYGHLEKWDSAIYYFEKAMHGARGYGAGDGVPEWSFYHRYGYALWGAGRKEEASVMFDEHIKLLTQKIEEGTNYGGHYYDLAATYAFLGQRQKALDALGQSPFSGYLYGKLHQEEMFESIRHDPGFIAITNQFQEDMLELRKLVKIDQYRDDLAWLLEFDSQSPNHLY